MNKVCAVVVTFHPPASLAENLAALQSQAEELVVVDNGTWTTWPVALQAALKNSGATLLANPENLGVATAFNQGLKHALSRGFEWAATFDQDSRPPAGFISGLFEIRQACPQREQVALVAPRYWLKDTPPPLPENAALPVWRTLSVAMASGNLVRLSAAQSVGWMDESFFIDYVDFDFCLRLRRHGWVILQAQDVWLPHRLGSRDQHRCLGFNFSLVAHNPLRRYYNARNRLVTYRRHALRFPGWFLHDLTWWGLEVGKILLFEKNKAAKCRGIWLGLKDALAGRMGPAPAATVERLQPPPATSPINSNSISHG